MPSPEAMEQDAVSNNGQEKEDGQQAGAEKGEMEVPCESCGVALETCKTELAAIKNQYLRTRADLENLTRRIEKERVQFVSVGQRAVLLDLLAIVDDFDRALREHSVQELEAQRGGMGEFDVREPAGEQALSEQESEAAAINAVHAHDIAQDRQVWLAGFALIRSSFYKLLEKYGVTPMTSQQYALFDPCLHEAIMQIASADHKPGEIVQVFLSGFMLGDQVLRPAQVSVAK